MEMMRAGDISAAQAARMWQSKWQAGNRQLTRYNGIARHGVYLRCP